jgi:hypothetical protein
MNNVTTAQLIAWAEAADATLATSDDYMTCVGADKVLTDNVHELSVRADHGDAEAAAWLGREEAR